MSGAVWDRPVSRALGRGEASPAGGVIMLGRHVSGDLVPDQGRLGIAHVGGLIRRSRREVG